MTEVSDPGERPAVPSPRRRVFVVYAYDSPGHEADVSRFCELLETNGVAVVFDKWIQERIAWGQATEKWMKESDFVLAVASDSFLRAANEEPGGAEHRGARAETGLLREFLQQDLHTWRPKILPVVFPGHSWREIPAFLGPCNETRFDLDELSETGLGELLRHIEGKPTRPRASPGQRPEPPRSPSPASSAGHPAPPGGPVWALSQAAFESFDIVVDRADVPVVRLSQGTYVPRVVEDRLVERCLEPGVTAIVGDAGHGKTTLLWRMHQTLAQAGRAPLLIPATALTATGPSPPLITVEGIDEALARARRSGYRPVLLIDTLDLLLHDLATRAQVNILLALSLRHQVPTLVTTRPVESRWLDIDYDWLAATENGRVCGGGIKGIPLAGFDDTELPLAVAAYARAFYPPSQVPEVIQAVNDASVRGLPLREICGNPLTLRMLFELYAATEEVPPPDIDAISLFGEYWRRRVEQDKRAAGERSSLGDDLTIPTECAALTLLTDSVVEARVDDLVGSMRRLVPSVGSKSLEFVTSMHSRGILVATPRSSRRRFFHQTFLEYAAARAVVAAGPAAVECLMARVEADPMDLRCGEVAGQLILLGDGPGPTGADAMDSVLARWLSADDSGLVTLALRTYARHRRPGPRARATAAEALGAAGIEAVRGYLALLPSISHDRFDRPARELGLVCRRAAMVRPREPKLSRQLLVNVIEALIRLAGTHPTAVCDFARNHECLERIADWPVTDWRHHDGLYFRLLAPLLTEDPKWCLDRLMALIPGFASRRDVAGLADCLTLINRIDVRMPLRPQDLAMIRGAVLPLETSTNAARLEAEYAALRARSARMSTSEVLAWTDQIVSGAASAGAARPSPGGRRPSAGPEGEPVSGRLSDTGRRAELRAMIAVAVSQVSPRDSDVELYWDTLLAHTDPASQKDQRVLLGTVLAMDPALGVSLAESARRRCAEALRLLPVRPEPSGTLPPPALFVRSLYEGRVSGPALLAALGPDVADELWLDCDALQPLLTSAASAGHPGAERALRRFVTGDIPASSADNVERAVLGRLRTEAEAGSRSCLEHLLDHAVATRTTTELRALVRGKGTTGQRLSVLLPFEERLVDLRKSLVQSGAPSTVTDGFRLWAVLLRHRLDSPPEPAELARILSRTPASQLAVAALETGIAAVDLPEWADHDFTPLVVALRAYLGLGNPSDEPAKPTVRWESSARELLIGVRARCLPFPSTAHERLAFARETLGLVWSAGYEVADEAGLSALRACFGMAAGVVERMPEAASAVDLILESARSIGQAQTRQSRWRKHAAAAWGGAIAGAVRISSDSENRRLISGLVAADQNMAQIAISNYVESIQSLPGWLRDLQPDMTADSRRRLGGAMKRIARAGGSRPFPELFEAACSSRSR